MTQTGVVHATAMDLRFRALVACERTRALQRRSTLLKVRALTLLVTADARSAGTAAAPGSSLHERLLPSRRDGAR